MAYNPLVVIVETRAFSTRLGTLLDPDQYRRLQVLLAGQKRALRHVIETEYP